MLDVCSISRSYDDFKAVDDVSFTVGRGEIVGLLGHNGAGKTTIMKMLSGYLEPDAGEIIFNDRPVSSEPSKLQRELGYLPENLPLYPELSVASYLDYAAELKGLEKHEKQREAVCDRALIVRHGRLAVDRKLSELSHSSVIRLRSSASDEELRRALSDLSDITQIRALSPATEHTIAQWAISLTEHADVPATIAACTQKLVSADVPVMGIAVEELDLQSLFLEVSDPNAMNEQELPNVR